MKIKQILILAASFAIVAAGLLKSARAGQVTFLWEETGSDITLNLSGVLDVAGWANITENAYNAPASFYNTEQLNPPGPSVKFQSLLLNGATNFGLTYNNAGSMVLSPWNTPTGVYLQGPFISGTFAGQIQIGENLAILVQTSDIVNGKYIVDAEYRFSNTTLDAMFGDGLPSWRDGATIATVGGNEIRFQAVPEPSTALLIGVGIFTLGFYRSFRNHKCRTRRCS